MHWKFTYLQGSMKNERHPAGVIILFCKFIYNFTFQKVSICYTYFNIIIAADECYQVEPRKG